MTYLIEMTLFMTVTAVILLLFKRIFKAKLTAKWQLWLWAVLLVRFFVPSLPESNVSVFNMLPEVRHGVQFNSRIADVITAPVPTEMPEQEEAPVLPSEQRVSSISPEDVVMTVWGVGMALLGLYFAAVYATAKLKKYPSADDSVRLILNECAERLGVKRKIRVFYGGESPMLMGVIKPRIVLPKGYSEGELRNIFLHELCHLKGGDIMITWLGILVLIFNWFNPVLWYSFFCFRRDIEVYCDERVLKYCESKKEYAELLLKTALLKTKFKAGTTALQNGEKEIERRIKHMVFFKKPRFIWSVVILAAAAAVSAGCLTNASYIECGMSKERIEEFSGLMVGSHMADIDYADSEKVVFHYWNGIFVYNLQKGEFEQAIDLSHLNCPNFQQGDTAAAASANGKEVFVKSYGFTKDAPDFDDYIIDLETAQAKKTRKNGLKGAGKNLSDSFSSLDNLEGWYSDRCVISDGKAWYLTVKENFYFCSMLIVERDLATGEEREWKPFLRYRTEKLYEYKGTLAGDAVRMRELVEQTNMTGYRVDYVELDTKAEPYGLTVFFEDKAPEKKKLINNEGLGKTTALLFALTENLKNVTYSFAEGEKLHKPDNISIKKSQLYQWTAMVDFTPKRLDGATVNYEMFEEFYADVLAAYAQLKE